MFEIVYSLIFLVILIVEFLISYIFIKLKINNTIDLEKTSLFKQVTAFSLIIISMFLIIILVFIPVYKFMIYVERQDINKKISEAIIYTENNKFYSSKGRLQNQAVFNNGKNVVIIESDVIDFLNSDYVLEDKIENISKIYDISESELGYIIHVREKQKNHKRINPELLEKEWSDFSKLGLLVGKKENAKK
jgi:heme/copper-type cytochrome/quinol oxidase subunit 2